MSKKKGRKTPGKSQGKGIANTVPELEEGVDKGLKSASIRDKRVYLTIKYTFHKETKNKVYYLCSNPSKQLPPHYWIIKKKLIKGWRSTKPSHTTPYPDVVSYKLFLKGEEKGMTYAPYIENK